MKKLFTLLTMLIVGIVSSWGDVLPSAVVSAYFLQSTPTMTVGGNVHNIVKDVDGNVTILPVSGFFGNNTNEFTGTLVIKINIPETPEADVIFEFRTASKETSTGSQGLHLSADRILATSWTGSRRSNGNITYPASGVTNRTLTAGEHTIIFLAGSNGGYAVVDNLSYIYIRDSGLKKSNVEYKAIYIPKAYAQYITEVHYFTDSKSDANKTKIFTECNNHIYASQHTEDESVTVESGKNLIIDVDANLSKYSGSGNASSIGVAYGKTLTVPDAKFSTNYLSKLYGTGSVNVSVGQTENFVPSSLNIVYTGGAGTTDSRVSINHTGNQVTLTGAEKNYYLTGSNSGTQTTVNFDGTNVNYDNELGIGNAIYNINNTQITTPKFITSQGANDRSAVVNLTGNSVITVTGNSNVDENTSSIMIGHWNGSSNVTLSGTAQIVAADAQLLVGKTRNNQTITLNDNSNITAKGIKTSANATGTNTLNLNGGSLNLGDAGITAYGNSMAVNVNGNTTITATAATLPLSQPITVASGKTLTIDGGGSNAAVTLTSTLTNNGTIILDDAGIGGSERITTKGIFIVKDLQGNNLTGGSNNYALIGNGTLNFEGTCDLTKKSDLTTNNYAKVGYGDKDNINIKEDAVVNLRAIYSTGTSDGSGNAAVTIETGASLTASEEIRSIGTTNNGTVSATQFYGPVTLGDGSTTTLSNAAPFNGGAVTVSGDATLNLTATTSTLSQAISVAANKTLTIDGKNNTVVMTGTVTNNGTINFKNATLTANLNDRTLANYTFTDCTATLQFVETGDEYKVGGFTITNIPSGVTVKVKKYGATDYETVTPTDGTVTISHSVGVSGSAAWFDYTFNESTKSINIPETPISTIPNRGNAGSGSTLTIDNSKTSATSYNSDGTLKVMNTPYRSITWPANYTVAVAGNVPDVENGCLVGFGSIYDNGNYIALIRGANQNEIKLVKGAGNSTAYEVISTMSASNATALSHLVVFTKNGNTFTVYLDGVQKTQATYSETLGGGLQIGSLYGGVGTTGIVKVSDIQDETIKENVFAKTIRVYDYVISDDQMSQLTNEFPYTSFGGKYSRTISENSNLSATGAWLNEGTQGPADIPLNTIKDEITYYPDVEITTSAASTLTVNADMDTDNIKFEGTGKLSIVSDGTHKISVYGSVTANGPVSVIYGGINISGAPVSLGESGSIEFDFSDFNFNKVYTTTKYQLTGQINQDDTHVTVTGLPSNDGNREYAFGFDDNHYWLTVTVREPQDVYLPSGATEITDDMAVKLTNDAATNNGLLIRGDNLIINNTGTLLFKESSGFCTFEVKGGATVTVNNKTNSDYALDGETITITNGTLKLNYGNGDAKINSATINVSENGTLDNYGWLTVDGTLTVNSNFDKTILNNSGAENPSQTRGTGKIVKGGTGTITMRAMPHCTENEVTTKHPIEITGGVLILSDGAKADAITGSGTLNVPAATSISVASIATGTTLTGNGNLALTSFPSATAPTLTDWRGTVELAAGGDVGNLTTIFNAWGNANSVIKLNSVTGWFESDYTVNPTLNILSDATVNINNGYSNKEPKLTKLTGAGILQQTWNPTGTTNHKLHIATLTGFTGTLKGTHQPIVVDRIVLNRKPAVGDLLIKTSGTVSLSSLVVGWQPISAYSWDTETHDEVTGIYVTAKDDVAEKRDLANAIVLPYDGYIGAGVNKYTVSLGDDKYTSMESYNDAINAWKTVDDYVTPSVTINQPTSAFYRIKAGDKYLQDARKSNEATQRTLTDAEGADEAIGTLFYLNDNTFVGYKTGYGFGFSVCQTQDTEQLNSMLFTESSELGKYTIQSQQGTCESASYNEGYWGVNGTELARVNDAASGACWTLEPATSVPVTFNSTALGYATFNSPVALIVPKDKVKAYVCKIEGNTIKMYYADQLKDDDNNWVLPENTPVLLYNSDYTNTPTVNLTITSDTDEEYENNGFNKGTVAAETPDADNYIYYALRKLKSGTVGFYQRANQTAALTGFRAWIAVPKTSGARNFTIEFDGDSDPTGIVEALGLEDANVEIYDLNGRKLSEYRKGINIVNGKKVFK